MAKVDVYFKTVILTIALLIGLWVVYQIRGVLLIWFVAFILMTALNPIVNKLEQYKIPRLLGIFISFILSLGVIGLIIASLIPTLVEQTSVLVSNFSTQFPQLPESVKLDGGAFSSQLQTISSSAANVLKILAETASNIFTIFSLIVLTVYLLIERQNLKHYLKLVFKDQNSEHKAEELIDQIEKRLGGWVRGEVILMFTIGVLTYIGLRLLGIPFALPLAILAGLLELIPNIGPIVSAIPAIIAGFTISPMIALGVGVLYLAVQQMENHLIVPLVMKQSAGVKPLVTLAALMVGGALGGVGGAILAIPLYLTGEVVIRYITKYRAGQE